MRCMNINCANFDTKKEDSCAYFDNPEYRTCRSFFTVGINDTVMHDVVQALATPSTITVLQRVTDVMTDSNDDLHPQNKAALSKYMPLLLILVKHLEGAKTNA